MGQQRIPQRLGLAGGHRYLVAVFAGIARTCDVDAGAIEGEGLPVHEAEGSHAGQHCFENRFGAWALQGKQGLAGQFFKRAHFGQVLAQVGEVGPACARR
jgi:hypothetical protein